MRRKGSGLADRFRRAVESEEQARKREDEDRQRRQLAAQAARETLFRDLLEFARALGFINAGLSGGALSMRHGDREVRFLPVGDSDRVEVDWEQQAEGERHQLYREANLNHRWVWVFTRRTREDRLPLFDDGLEEILVRGLGLPRPDDVDEANPSRSQ